MYLKQQLQRFSVMLTLLTAVISQPKKETAFSYLFIFFFS
jgi:hypothetical protein